MPATDILTDQELFDAINERASDSAKAKEFAKTLRAKCPSVAQPLIDVGAGQKSGETKKELTELQSTIRELKDQLEEKDRELAKVKADTPDVAAIEESTRKKFDARVKKAEQERDEATQRFEKAFVQIGVDKGVALLIAPNEQGIRTHPDYAKLIAAEALRKQMAPKADGTLAVKQIGEESEYEGATLDEKIAALVKDYRAYVPADFQFSNADGGAGVRNGGGGGGLSGLKTQEQLTAQKANEMFGGI